MWHPATILVVAALACGPLACGPDPASVPARPNIVLIVADDLGYGELGSYGQEKIRTPVLDRLAEQGMRFTRHYSGSPVCAPSRATLLTGLHTGHAVVRDNDEMVERGAVWADTLIEGNHPLPPDTYTLGRMLQDAGYVTAAIGKWGLGGPGDSGEPNLQGFDHWYGYMCQREAHNYYPTHLWRDGVRETLPGNSYFSAHQRLPAGVDPTDLRSYERYAGETYSFDVMIEDAVRFVRARPDDPFFLYLPFTIPHVALQVPEESLAEYADEFDDAPYTGDRGYLPHRAPRAAYAAMITRMDAGIGRILGVLEETGVEGNTVVLFTSDNGPTFNGGTDSEFFASTGGLRGLKASLYEGGIRVPLIVRWPGKVAPGSVTDHVSAFWDYLATLAEIAHARPRHDTDGLSLVPVLTGNRAAQPRHDLLYWEYNGAQAVLSGDWKVVRQRPAAPLQLFDLSRDPAEAIDVAAEHPDVIARLTADIRRSRTPSAWFPLDPKAAARLGRVRSACGIVSTAARRATSAMPSATADPGGPGAPAPRCAVELRLDVTALRPTAEPMLEIRDLFAERSWNEVVGSAAAGPGTSVLAFDKGDVRCVVEAGWEAIAVDGEIVERRYYYMRAECSAAT